MSSARSRRGVALVLTLIMLAIITVVTVVFLATARRNRVTTTLQKDQTDAEFATEYAFQRATAEIMTNILGFRAPLVTNGVRVIVPEPDSLAVDFFVSRTNLTTAVVPPVTNLSGSIERYLDLNRNRRFDDSSQFTNYPYGDPMWIGVLDHPWLPPAVNNRFVARYAYVVLPVGKMLDLNTIHNATSPNNGYRFSRNQGFGSWELNLGAFLAELEPGVWYDPPSAADRYSYGPFPKPSADGLAFADARSLVDYRNGWGLDLSPRRLQDTFPLAIVAPVFPGRSIDAYADGDNGAVLGANPFLADDDFPAKTAWPGADSTNHYFEVQDLFQVVTPNKVNAQFYGDITNAIGRDPLAYYRMISQLGTDTGTDFDDRINLNYADWHAGYAVTNFISWDSTPALAVTFFTNVAQKIFLAQSNEFNNLISNTVPIRSITEIPIFPTNCYSSAIHRILQEAANIFDATRTNEYPSVFRPIFGTIPSAPKSRYIIGFVNDDRVSTLPAWLDANTNGIPLVIGAKKGFPNFNELTIRTEILVTRKLEVTRTVPRTPGSFLDWPSATNQMYVLGISNYFGVEAWNPYRVRGSAAAPYPRPLTIFVTNLAFMTLTNDLGFLSSGLVGAGNTMNIPAGTWSGGEESGFEEPLSTNVIYLSNAVYRFANNSFADVNTNDFERGRPGFPMPYWVFGISNRMTYWMEENGRILDCVILQDSDSIDLYRDLYGAKNPYLQAGIGNVSTAVANVWNTNRLYGPNGPTEGIRQQLDIALGNITTANADWRAFALAATPGENDKNNAIDAFRYFSGLTPFGSTFKTNNTLAMQAPFNPAAKLAVLSSWQANDPLVHYHAADLRLASAATNHQYLKPSQQATNITPSSLGRMNDRYSPWGGNPQKSTDPNEYNRAVKDPGIYSPDEWIFPTNKLASIGLLGRVHRGTPWQTVYLKSERAPLTGNNGWNKQSPDIARRQVLPGVFQDFSRTHPTNDWKLADMFTTALDERTSRGMMSVNQQGLESWSALLSGVVVLSNSMANPQLGDPRQYTEMFIEPWGQRPFPQSQLALMWSNVHWFQTNLARPMRSAGDILQIPELTVKSPFLDQGGNQTQWGLDDFAYERIPQQILSLLRVGQSRFVIYAYGQALKPAAIDPADGRVSNYQVTAEYATRTVVRVEGDPNGRLRTVVESFNILPPD